MPNKSPAIRLRFCNDRKSGIKFFDLSLIFKLSQVFISPRGWTDPTVIPPFTVFSTEESGYFTTVSFIKS